MDYDDDRYYIANNIRNAQYALHPNPNPNSSPNANPLYGQKAIAIPNCLANNNRYVTHPKLSLTNVTTTSNDPRQDVGLPRSSIV